MEDHEKARIATLATHHPALDLLVLHGSRARGNARPGSDWDLGYLAGPAFDVAALLADLVGALSTEDVDLVDLARASSQLRYRTAADSVVLFEAQPGTFDAFWLDAVSYWCDMQGTIRHEYEAALARLPP